MLILESVLLSYFIYATGYALILSVAALFYRGLSAKETTKFSSFAVFIPAYKEDGVIIEVARQARRQNYPTDLFDVIVIADSLLPKTLTALRDLDIQVVEVSFEKSTKVKALNRAMSQLTKHYDSAIIIDADNVMADNYLQDMNSLYQNGSRVIQTQRKAKNSDTSLSVLDGMSERINNFIYRQGTVTLGGCASLSGSGMMFPYDVLKDTLRPMDSIGGFDRELELKLLDLGYKVNYAKDIFVYDEKVSSSNAFQNQRKRWMYSQFYYLKKYFKTGFGKLLKGDVAYFNSAVLRNIQLPRLINLGMITVITIAACLIPNAFPIFSYGWVVLWVMFATSMALAIPAKSYDLNLLKSIILLPAIFIKMTLLLFKLKGANRTFIHTPHSVSSLPTPND
jgi:cellulose synthase/poly-beta-1,6-N-acetylglucosamine synthase-like glycosyltransferase